MPELYAYMQSIITTSAPFFYLSASPYSLYPFLRGFRDAHYPHGQLILRDANLLTVSGLLSNLTLGTEKYKVDRIQKIRHWFPRRKIIIIGDSTQSDPEAYGKWLETCSHSPASCLTSRGHRRHLQDVSRVDQIGLDSEGRRHCRRRNRREERAGKIRQGICWCSSVSLRTRHELKMFRFH